jgi:integrase
MELVPMQPYLLGNRLLVRCSRAYRATNRNGHRDATMVLVAYRHGLRPVELVTLRRDAIDFPNGQIHVSRAKNGSPSVHPLSGVEPRALRRLKRDQEPSSPFVFTSERGAPFTTAGWRKMVARLGVAAKLGFKAHPHMFRHACSFQPCQPGHRHTHPASVSRPPQHPAYRALYRTVAHALQKSVARLKGEPATRDAAFFKVGNRVSRDRFH